MPKLKLKIDTEIDFRVEATVEAFGYETEAVFRLRKKVAGQVTAKLEKGDIVELTTDEYSELSSEENSASDE